MFDKVSSHDTRIIHQNFKNNVILIKTFKDNITSENVTRLYTKSTVLTPTKFIMEMFSVNNGLTENLVKWTDNQLLKYEYKLLSL